MQDIRYFDKKPFRQPDSNSKLEEFLDPSLQPFERFDEQQRPEPTTYTIEKVHSH